MIGIVPFPDKFLTFTFSLNLTNEKKQKQKPQFLYKIEQEMEENPKMHIVPIKWEIIL